MRIRVLLLSLLFIPFLSYAETYNWGLVNDDGQRWPSPAAFANDYKNTRIDPRFHANCEIRLSKVNEIRYNWARYCQKYNSQGVLSPNFSKNGDGAIQLYGDSCPEGESYDTDMDSCIPDEPEEPEECSMSDPYPRFFLNTGILGPNLELIPADLHLPSPACWQGCLYRFSGWEPDVYGKGPEGPGREIWQGLHYRPLGQQCTES